MILDSFIRAVGESPTVEPAVHLYNQLNTVDDIRGLVGKEENLLLEVKRATVPMSDDDKKNLSIALSGFANSSGGVLIFGLLAVKADNDEPDIISKEEPIKDLDRFLPEVQSLIGEAVFPIVDKVQAKAVRYAGDLSRGFVLVLIPESDRGPHRAMLKKTSKQYYKRAGDSFYMMEHFDLADMFGKRRRPDLRVRWRLGHISFSLDKPYRFAIILGLENTGRGIARYPLLEMRSMSGALLFDYGIDGNRHQGLPLLEGDRPGDLTLAGGVNDVIHPATIKEIVALGFFDATTMPDINFRLTVAAEDLEAQMQQIEIKAETVKKILSEPAKHREWFPI